MNKKLKKFYWHANTSSGGTLGLSVNFEGEFSRGEQESALADALKQCYESMEQSGYIPFSAQLMSSRDIAEKYGKTRQYWEKLLNEGKILYKETSAGRITTDLWVNGYLGNKEGVDQYVKNVRKSIKIINESGSWSGKIFCPVCEQSDFDFAVNYGRNINGVCRSCHFHVYTTN